MRVLAIGATGVLREALVPLLLERGHELTVMAPGRRLETLPSNVVRFRASLLDEDVEQHLARALGEHEAVLNVATAMPRDFTAPGAWDANTRVRVEGTRRLMRAARSARIPRLVQMSITMAYPDGGDAWQDESTPFDPDPQRAALVEPVCALEAAIRALPVGDLRWTILRAARFVGPGTIQDVHRRQMLDGTLAVAGDDRSFVSMVHIGDFASAAVAAVEADTISSAVLNVSDEPVRLGSYVDGLASIDGLHPPSRVPGAVPDLPSQRVDSSNAHHLLGWVPQQGIWPHARSTQFEC